MRKFYLTYPNWQTVSFKLSWSHYLELIKITEEAKRNFVRIRYRIYVCRIQVRITLEEEHFYPDLKIGKVTHQDIGQRQMYVNYYDREIKNSSKLPTVGILLSTEKIKLS